MPFLSGLAGLKSTLVILSVSVSVVAFQYIQNQQLKSEIDTHIAELKSAHLTADVAKQFNASLNQTIQSMGQQLADAQKADDWVRKLDAAMAANLEKAKDDIGTLIDEQETNSTGCVGRFSDAVYQRMLDVYQPDH